MTGNQKRLTQGSRLGAYTIVRLIGEGGMGEVYEAHDDILHRQVALKIISPQFSGAEEIIKRFMAEGKALARLNHHNVVGVYALGEENGIHYIAMEYVDGRSLYDVINSKGQLSVEEALRPFLQLLEGVKALHDSGIIHRDIKPKNIIIRRDKSLKIVDFGIAKIQGQNVDALTNKGQLVGSIYYVSPEIIDGREATAQSDIWSLGVNLYEMLIGKNPFEAERWLAVVDKITKEGILFPKEWQSKIPDAIQRIILKMCERNVEKRYNSVSEIIADVEAYRQGRPAVHAPVPVPSLPTAVPVSHPRSMEGRSGARIPDPKSGSSSIKMPASKSSSRMPMVAVGILAVMAIVYFGAFHFQSRLQNVKELVSTAPTLKSVTTTIPSITSLLQPSQGQKIWLDDKNTVKFVWSGQGGQSFFLQIAGDQEFKNLIVQENNPTSPFTTTKLIHDGNYYWRLLEKTASGERAIGESRSFTVISLKAPALLYPLKNISYGEGQAVKLYWQEKTGLKQYRLQVASDQAFTNLYLDQLISDTQSGAMSPPAGEYFWRVRGEENPALSTAWSDLRVLRIQKPVLSHNLEKTPAAPTKVAVPERPVAIPKLVENRQPTAPKIQSPLQKMILKYKSGVSRIPASSPGNLLNPPQLSWSKISGVNSYEVQVSRKSDFSQIEWTKNSSNAKATWETAQVGRFYWRVRSMGPAGKSTFSTVGVLELNLPSPQIKKKFDFKMKPEGGKVQPWTVSWEPVAAASGYKIVVSENKSFTPIKMEMKVDRSTASLALEGPGSYFVKVAPLASTGESAGDFSTPAKLTIQGFQAPAPEVKKEMVLAVPQAKLPPNGVSIVSLSGGQDPISFRWEEIDAAEFYRLEISANEKFTPTLFATAVAENQYVLTANLPKGKVFWRVRAENGNVKSAWSPVFSFDISK